MPEPIGDRWRALVSEGLDQVREADAGMALRFLFGIDGAGHPLLVLVSTQKPGLPDLGRAITVERGRRAIDQNWALTLICADPSLTDTFISFGEDLVLACAKCDSEREAMQEFLRAVDEWKRLLLTRKAHLSEADLRALIAELWAGFCADAVPWTREEAALAWSRPLGQPQDFRFSDRPFVVVRDVSTGADIIEIAGLNQLDEQPTTLLVVTLTRVADGTPSLKLRPLVELIRNSFPESAQRSEFNRRLVLLGMNMDDPWYDDFAYVVRRLRFFQTAPPFPALRHSELPPAIRQARYRVDLAQTPEFCTFDVEIDPMEEQRA